MLHLHKMSRSAVRPRLPSSYWLYASKLNGLRVPRHFLSVPPPPSSPSAALSEPSRLDKIGAGHFDTLYSQFLDDKLKARKSSFISENKTVVHMSHSDELDENSEPGRISVDGNTAVAHAAYALSEIAFIYPITPSSSMGEQVDLWAAGGRKNCFDQTISVTEMQSEGGAAGALHGALKAGSLGTSFTASQGLLLMIPNMYKIAGELLPCVLHVAARSLATHSLSIFGDHQDVMAVRQTGWTMLVSENVQMAHDMALLSHLATLETRVPILHFFDGFRTSSEINNVKLVDYDELKKVIPYDLIKKHRDLALSPIKPHLQGLAQGPDVYFQATEAANPVHDRVEDILQKWSDKLSSLIGRKYAFFSYHGAPDATDIIIIMGSGAVTVNETVSYLQRTSNAKVGVIAVRLYRPWSPQMLLDAIPETVQRIAVLDRSKDITSLGEPLFLDVSATLMHSPRFHHVKVFGGRYGLSSKEFTPGMVISVFENLVSPSPKPTFTVGINDDVTHLSLPVYPEPDLFPAGTTECLFYGLGSDGTVGSNKTAVKLVSKHTELHTQAYFQYDAKKSGGITISHVRFSPQPIHAPFNVLHADYIGVHRVIYLERYEIFSQLKYGGTAVVNFPYGLDKIDTYFPASVKRELFRKKAKLYIVNANKVAQEAGMGKMINMIMQTAFFKLANVMPFEEALEVLKEDIQKTYGKKNQKIIENNLKAVEMTAPEVIKVEIPASWEHAKDGVKNTKDFLPPENQKPSTSRKDFVKNILKPMNSLQGNDLPVSAFEPGGRVPTGTSSVEKRTIALKVPKVDMAKCIQCNYCSLLCPHAAIRPFLLNPQETDAAPASLKDGVLPAIGGGVFDKFNYRIQVSPRDCTGCELCARICPGDALQMVDIESALENEEERWDYLSSLPNKADEIDVTSVRGSQFQQPLLEFSGACEGCGETPYVKLLTQLVGNRLIISNATGCSSIWAGSMPSIPYTTNAKGEGPAWANSLFEDNAEFGLGMRRAYKQRREKFVMMVDNALQDISVPISTELRALFSQYAALRHDNKHDMLLAKGKSAYHKLYEKIVPLLENEYKNHYKLKDLWDERELFSRPSHWIIGGDGWAYDIGFGGLDHILCSEEHVKVLVLDTEMYSNTGGQASKSTPSGSLTRFAETGKSTVKKDLGQYAMSYKNVYVASICVQANHQHAVRAILEAEAYPGPALVICYSPCISHGYPLSQSIDHCREAVQSGYWPLYRYNPELALSGNNPFQLESKKVTADLYKFLAEENRYAAVMRQDPAHAKVLDKKLEEWIAQRQTVLKILGTRKADSSDSGVDSSVPEVTVLYGSETGNAEELAKILYEDLKSRKVPTALSSLDDFEFEDLPKQKAVLILCSTCGQGEFPSNSRNFWKRLSDPSLPMTFLSHTKFSVFGLGDSTYCNFCTAAISIDVRLQELGAVRIRNRGIGDDRHDDRFYSGWDVWEPELWDALGSPKLPLIREIPKPAVTIEKRPSTGAAAVKDMDIRFPGSTPLKMLENRLLTPVKYDRDIRHYAFDLTGSGLKYEVGDALAVYPKAQAALVSELYKLFDFNPTDELTITPVGDAKTNLPSELTVDQLFSYVLDITGQPKRKFYDNLSLFATDPEEKKTLELMGSTEPAGKELLRDHTEKMVNYIDVLREFPSARPPLEHLATMVPRIKPRLYSISSSPKMFPDHLQCTIIQVDWEVEDIKNGRREMRTGLCTTYLKNTQVPSEVAVQVRKSGIHLPEDPRIPVIMVGMGTGLAPWRGIVQTRVAEKRSGQQVGAVWLYFGARKAASYRYREEFEPYEEGENTISFFKFYFEKKVNTRIW
eukprot:TRINITY_DN5793_c0_g1_i2.p1 TRINITY_DN5793_c0_g1~~TRINITY_DN5793_c0_g1_i2.p1  ORF type:complete len:1820 (+),score=413.59 TRINITY_DN5793_c0_g1_i2:47-5506(+)